MIEGEMSRNRAPIVEGQAGRPTLAGQAISDGEVLGILIGGEWRRVTLGKSKERDKRWVLRFVDHANLSVLAMGTPARRPERPRR